MRKLTQAQAAKVLGVTPGYLCRLIDKKVLTQDNDGGVTVASLHLYINEKDVAARLKAAHQIRRLEVALAEPPGEDPRTGRPPKKR